jgi:hypothetical protein
VVLTRQPDEVSEPARVVYWDGRTLGTWAGELEGAAAVLNLAGRSVNCRYHAANRRAIMDSRIESTRVLGEAIAGCARPPPVWLNSSTATIYRHSLDRAMDETTGEIGATPEAKDAFSIEVARAWEQELEAAAVPATRKLALWTAMVFGRGAGGVFAVLRRLTRWGLGGAMAGGRQYVSWIHEEDFCRAIEWLIGRSDLTGAVNLAAPNPVTNAEMMRLLRHLCRVPIGLPATRWMLEIGTFLLRTESELVIKSRRVVPRRLLAAGFEFRFPRMQEALANLLQRTGQKPPMEATDTQAGSGLSS